MKAKTGIYKATKKDGTIYYRSNITYKNKHISLGSYLLIEQAHSAYLDAKKILNDSSILPDNYSENILKFDKAVILMNFRDSGLYFATPLYMKASYILYYYDKNTVFTFDREDLFYYGKHKIMKRGSHLFVSEYGMQVNILNRYGIKNFAVINRDYKFANQNCYDFRYSNIVILVNFHGVQQYFKNSISQYRAYIHINGNYLIGTYVTEIEAAIAYNKAVDILKKKGVTKNFPTNYIESLSPLSYAETYQNIKISPKLFQFEINKANL